MIQIKDYQDIIDTICIRLNKVITPLEVVAWLDNFERADWSKALSVLNHFEYFSINDIIREFDNSLSYFLNTQPLFTNTKEKIYLVPLGKSGKSGAAMIYFLKKTPTFNNKRFEIIEKLNFSKVEDKSKVIIVDDYAGTGGSIIDFYEKIKPELPDKCRIYALTVAYMEKAKDNLSKHKIKILGNERIPSFSQRGSVFGYYPKMRLIRKFCFEYGNRIYSEENYKRKKSKQHPLGYSNTQALIGFEHSIPNNTLPIMWADSKVIGENRKWIPLFPRRGDILINKAKEFKQSQSYWSSLFFKLGLNINIFSLGEKYERQTLQLISLIYLKKKHKNMIQICQMLGIGFDEYESIIDKAKEKQLIDLDNKVTDQASRIFDELKKKNNFKRNLIEPNLMIEENILYIPKQFRGRS